MRAAAAVALVVILIAIHALAQEGPPYDPAPPALLLRDALLAITSEDYARASELIGLGLNMSIEGKLGRVHEETFLALKDTVTLIKDSLANPSREKAYELFRAREQVGALVERYASIVRDECPDPATGYRLYNDLMSARTLFLNHLDDLIERVYVFSGPRNIEVAIRHPPVVVGGEFVNVTVSMGEADSVDCLNVTVKAVAASYKEIARIACATPGNSYTVTLKAPGAEDVPPDTRYVAFTALVIGSSEGREYTGYNISKAQLYFEKPLLLFNIPSSATPGGNLTIGVRARIDYSLNASVYFGRISPDSLIENITIRPGYSTYPVPLSNKSGVIIVYVVVWPHEKYLGYVYSKAVAVFGEIVIADVRAPAIVFSPPFSTILNVRVGNITGRVRVYVGGTLAKEFDVSGSSSAVIPLPPTLTAWSYPVTVEVVPNESRYAPYTYRGSIIVVNIYGTVAISMTLIAILTSRRVREFIKHPLERGGIAGSIGRIRALSVKRARLTRLYKAVVEHISTEVDPPKPWETLREFGARAAKRLKRRVADLLTYFLALYEEDLYSDHIVNEDEAEKLVEEILR